MSAVRLPKRVYIVSHTHWDREWYLTLHQFRVKLARVLRKVLDRLEDDSEFEHFVLDGQTLVLEDYLAVHPEDEARIRQLVEAGRLSLGPWYILPDEILVSGESTIRNLQIGIQVADRFGGAQPVGYMPDSFGHISQIPQILKLAGLDSFLYTRGNGEEIDALGLEYLWRAPDGSEVLAIHQCGGYCNAGGLGFEEIWHAHTRRTVDLDRAETQVRELFEKMTPRSNGEIFLLNNGCDHFPPQQEFDAVLTRLRTAYPEVEFLHTGFAPFVEAIRESGVARSAFEGELLSGKEHHILSGVWSARIYLKQKNEEAESLLAGTVEPLASYAHFAHGLDYPAGLLEAAWKLLLQNHPHDSICGCSIDPVHVEMGPRFAGVLESGNQIAHTLLEELTPHFARSPNQDRETVVSVFNPLPIARDEIVERMVVLQPGIVDDLEQLRLFDEAGNEIPFRILETRFVERFWGIDYRAALDVDDQREQFSVYLEHYGDRILRDERARADSDCFLTIQFPATGLPGVGHRSFYLREIGSPGAPARETGEGRPSLDAVQVQAGEDPIVLENGIIRVTVHASGLLDLEEIESGNHYEGLHRFEDTEDVGDEYDYAPSNDPADSRTLRSGANPTDSDPVSTPRSLEATFESGARATATVKTALELPAKIQPDRKRRSESTVTCEVETTVTVTSGSPLVEITTTFENRAEDHRLRVEFPTGIASDEIVSEGQFHIHRRPARFANTTDWVQPPTRTYPQQGYSMIEDGARGLAVLNRGLPEVAPLEHENGSLGLSLTLLRAVGWLSRDDFDTRRRQNAGPTVATPDAQCPGRHRFRYALYPFRGTAIDADVKGWSDRYRTPLRTLQGVEDLHHRGGNGLLEKATSRTAISAIQRHPNRDTLIVRLFNLTREATHETLRWIRPPRSSWILDLRGRRLGEIVSEGRNSRLELSGHQILTVEVDLA